MPRTGAEPLPGSITNFAVQVREALRAWHRRTARDLPWRGRVAGTARPGAPINDPWLVLVSEVMLQQTQADRIAAILPRFLARYPDARALAAAPRADVLRAWSGLGYNSRAVRLHLAASVLVNEHDGVVPREIEAIATLPGVGPYTASAVACFAYGVAIPVVETNVVRVLSRIFFKCYDSRQRMPPAIIHRLAAALLPSQDAVAWNEALMDLGATVCTAARPACDACVVSTWCLSRGVTQLGLFDPAVARRAEPQIAGVPRRLWRGRIIQWLREQTRPRSVDELVSEVAAAHGTDPGPIDRDLRGVVTVLISEGLIDARERGLQLA